MIKTTYSQWFEDFWKQALALKTRTLGSKPDAYKSAKSLKMGADDVEMVIQTFKSHTDRIRRNKAGWGDFIPDHKDMCRWLKERRWENEEDEDIGQHQRSPEASRQALSKSERRDEAARRYLEGSNGDGMAWPTGNEVSTR